MKGIRFVRALLATPHARRALGYLLMSLATLCLGAASLFAPAVPLPDDNGETVMVRFTCRQ